MSHTTTQATTRDRERYVVPEKQDCIGAASEWRGSDVPRSRQFDVCALLSGLSEIQSDREVVVFTDNTQKI